MRLIFWFIVALIAVLLALFAASNRADVALALWPLPFVLELPLYLAILATLAIGFVAGGLSAWISGRRRRRDARRRGRRIAALERELAATQARLPGAATELPARQATRG